MIHCPMPSWAATSGQAGLADDLRARDAELAFPELRIPRHQAMPDDQIEDCISEKLEALVVLETGAVLLVAPARVA